MPKYSFVIPVRNWWNYIKSAIDSILEQDYQDWDLHILYNNSSDNTLEIIESYSDPRIRIYESEKDFTIVENWQRILDLDLWEYLTISWHDDIFYPDFLDEINSLIEKHPNASLYQTHYYLINKDWAIIRKCREMPEKEDSLWFVIKRAHNQRDSYGTWYVMKSSDYKKVWWIPPFEGLFAADDALWVMLCNLWYKATSPNICFAYRKHITSAAWKEMDLTKWILWLHQYLDFLIENKEKYNIDNKIIEIINYKFNLANSLYSSELWKNKESWKFLIEANKYSKRDFFLEKFKMVILLCIPLYLRIKIINYWKLNLR